jgi:hypothetical protein
LSGILEVHGLCWGDPRFAPAVTAMSLLDGGRPTACAEAWLALAGGRADASFWLYVAICCVNRMAELGAPSHGSAGSSRTGEWQRLELVIWGLIERIDGGGAGC